MKHHPTLSFCCAALAALAMQTQAQAADSSSAKDTTGPYVGAAFGPAFGNREIDDSQSSNDEGLGRGSKLFGGYQFNTNFGVQAGYVRLRGLNQNTGSGAALVDQKVNGRSVYLAGTGRLPLGASFALTGKLGVASNKVSSARPATAATGALLGSKTSLLVGSGAEYVLNQQLSFAVELESYGKLSGKVKGNTLTLVTRFTF